MGDTERSSFYKHLDGEVTRHDAGKEIHDMDKRKSVTDHTHYFRQVAGTQIRCDCGWGLFLGLEDVLTDGHLYSNGEKIV